MPPVRREHPERIPLLVGDGVRLEKQRAVKILHLHAGGGEAGLDDFIPRDDRGLVAPVPIDRARARLGDEIDQHRNAVSARQPQPRPPRPQRSVQRRQRMMQPPARRAARRPLALACLIENVNGQHRTSARQGRMQRGVVLQTQVLAEPEDDRGSAQAGPKKRAVPQKAT